MPLDQTHLYLWLTSVRINMQVKNSYKNYYFSNSLEEKNRRNYFSITRVDKERYLGSLAL